MFVPELSIQYYNISAVFAGLTLVSAPHLARSYQHLFPLPQFTETDLSTVVDEQRIR